MYLRRGSSESSGATSPASERNGAPKRCRAVGVLSSPISYLVCCEMSSRLRSACALVSLEAAMVVLHTMLLLARQDGTLWRHRHHGELGVVGISSRQRSRALCARGIGFFKARDWWLGSHGGGFCRAVELDGRWGVCRHYVLLKTRPGQETGRKQRRRAGSGIISMDAGCQDPVEEVLSTRVV